MTTIHVFPGQGSQHKGMGEGLFQRYPALVRQADQVLGYSIEELCLRDPRAQLSQTAFTQPALYTVSALSWLAQREDGAPAPNYLAGHSLGEFTALFAAEAFDFITGLRIVQRRGELMGQASGGAMAAVLGLALDQVEAVLARAGLSGVGVANYNTTTQTILSGKEEEIEAIGRWFEEQGARYIRLNVSAAFHSSYMAKAQAAFATFLKDVNFSPLRTPVVSNYTAKPYPKQGYVDLIEKQITHPVRWLESISALCHLPQATFKEVGPGLVLSKIVADIQKKPAQVPPFAAPWDAPAPVSRMLAPREDAVAPVVFMFGGQGGQYYRMGEAMYRANAAFRAGFDRCSEIVGRSTGMDLVEMVYRSHDKLTPFDRTTHTHPALFAIGYSLHAALMNEGIEPDALIGYSLGEYVAAVASGALSLEDGLMLVTRQAELVEARTPELGALMVLAGPQVLMRFAPVFDQCELAGLNYDENIVVVGPVAQLEQASAAMKREGIISRTLPLRHGFHAACLDTAKPPFEDTVSHVRMRAPRWPITGCSEGSVRPDTGVAPEGLWQAVRGRLDFKRAIASFDEHEDTVFVDLSPSGSLANFIKHGFGGRRKAFGLLNQFGQDLTLLATLRAHVAARKAPAQTLVRSNYVSA